MRQNKRGELHEWLNAHPDKTERDWLIEHRCTTAQQRADLERLLDLCEYLGVRYMFKHIDFLAELNEFCEENQEVADIQNFKVEFSKFIDNEKPEREYDLYFPTRHWIINIGDEQWDVDTQMRGNILADSRTIDFCSTHYRHLLDKFIAFLNDKYHYPGYDKGNDSDKTYLSWCKELESANLPGMKGYNVNPSYVSLFYELLFKEDFDKASKKSIEDFLVKNPDLCKLRTELLHDHCKSLLTNKKLELDNMEIKKLLNQADKELAATYPAFKEAALM